MGEDSRTEDRSNVFLVGTLHDRSGSSAVRIRNVSAMGALVDGAKLPAVGTRVRLVRGSLSAAGKVAWQQDEMAGLNFDRQIDVDAWVQRVAHRGQQRVDQAVAKLRQADPLGEELDPAIAPSLVAISAELDGICERLANGSKMSIELAEELLRLDALAQSVRRLAKRD